MVTEEQVMEALNQCKDPEIPMVSIVDLGLIYGVDIQEDVVHVTMTLTTPGCGMAKYMVQEAKMRVENIDGVKEANVQLVWDPPWTPERMSEDVRKRLGFL